MKCKKCPHFRTEMMGGHAIDRCDIGKGLTWDRNAREYLPCGFCACQLMR